MESGKPFLKRGSMNVQKTPSIESEKIYDAVIVLGGGVDNGKASAITLHRLKTAISVILSGLSQNLILTGSREEIEAMYQEATKLGIRLESIFKCNPSKTTIGNAYYAKIKLIELEFKRVVLVTSSFHMERALAIFRRILGECYEVMEYPSHEEVNEEILKREENLKALIPLLNLFKEGDHEAIMSAARAVGIEE
jgi:uncharacterized SAM-binding protein YcdF (DUF218 family)